MQREIERRSGEELRISGGDAEPVKIEGYAAVWDDISHPIGGVFREVFRRGAFSDALKSGREVVARLHHDSAQLLASTLNGTLRLNEDERGLKYEAFPNLNTSAGKDALEYMKRGDIRFSSFAFIVTRGGTNFDKTHTDGLPLREVTRVEELVDGAPVVGPAYQATSVSARAVEEARALSAATVPVQDEPPAGTSERANELPAGPAADQRLDEFAAIAVAAAADAGIASEPEPAVAMSVNLLRHQLNEQ